MDPTTTLVVASDIEMSDATVERTIALPNPEIESNTTHVVLASGPGEPPSFVERRKNPADVLRKAIEREPDRSDLRLKLLELYYTAAAQNRRAFLEVTRQLAQNEKLASPTEWSQIADMGRVIAPDDELFCDPTNSKAVA
jgi:Tfp pilus assembly protein FimV